MALLGAFLFGSSYGALQVEHRWGGNGLVPNLLSILLDGVIAVGMMSGMWGLTALRLRIGASICFGMETPASQALTALSPRQVMASRQMSIGNAYSWRVSKQGILPIAALEAVLAELRHPFALPARGTQRQPFASGTSVPKR